MFSVSLYKTSQVRFLQELTLISLKCFEFFRVIGSIAHIIYIRVSYVDNIKGVKNVFTNFVLVIKWSRYIMELTLLQVMKKTFLIHKSWDFYLSFPYL